MACPKSVYVDKHTTYKSWAEPTIKEQLADHRPMSQFEKSMADLAIDVIHANSPQAKGRVERLFRTLQDRLVRELRLAGISSVEKAKRVPHDLPAEVTTGDLRSRLHLPLIFTGLRHTAGSLIGSCASEKSVRSGMTLPLLTTGRCTRLQSLPGHRRSWWKNV